MGDGTPPDWAREELALRRIMGEWIERSILRQHQIPYRGGKRGHDEGSFTASWCGHYLLTGDARVLDFMQSLRDQYLAYSEDHQHHGYDEWGEVHHQTEHYMIFLTRLWQLCKGDRRTIEAIEDAAHHAGNWIDGVPEWYDWDAHRFRSWSLGTRLVQSYPPYDFNVPDHFKVIQMALTAYLATEKARYLDLCCDYVGMWADLILQTDADKPPSVLFATEMSRAERERIYAGQEGLGAPVVRWYYDAPRSTRTELHVAAGSLEVMLDLHRITGERRYAEAVNRMLPPIIEAVADPDAEIPAMVLAKYRWATGDRSYDATLTDLIVPRREQDISRLVLLSGAIHERQPIVGRIGRRSDQVRWGYQREDGSIVLEAGPSPASLMLGYEISGDLSLATRALAKARRRMELAVFALRDGREHGCAAHSVHSIAAGHGRATGAGCVTTTLYPFALGAHRYMASERPAVQYKKADGSLGLPEGVAARWQPPSKGGPRIELRSLLGEYTPVRISLLKEGLAIKRVLVHGEPYADFQSDHVRLSLPPLGRAEVLLRSA